MFLINGHFDLVRPLDSLDVLALLSNDVLDERLGHSDTLDSVLPTLENLVLVLVFLLRDESDRLGQTSRILGTDDNAVSFEVSPDGIVAGLLDLLDLGSSLANDQPMNHLGNANHTLQWEFGVLSSRPFWFFAAHHLNRRVVRIVMSV